MTDPAYTISSIMSQKAQVSYKTHKKQEVHGPQRSPELTAVS